MKTGQKSAPPKLAIWLLERFCSYDFIGMALWDLNELYQKNRVSKGKFRADLIYFIDAAGIIFYLFFKGKSQYSTNNTAMFKNNLVVTFRNFKRDKLYFGLNVLGLIPGLVLFMLLALYTANELSFDRYHEKVDRLYRVYKEDVGNFYQGTNFYAVVPTPLGPAMKKDYPEVVEIAHINYSMNRVVKANDQIYLEPRVHQADPEIFDLFSLELLVGNPETALRAPDAAVISESAALKYFGRTDVLGETIHYMDEFPARITGVIADMPRNSHFIMDVILNFEGVVSGYLERRMNRWDNSSYYTFLLLSEEANAEELQAKLPELREKYADDPVEDGQESIYYLQSVKDMHFTREVNFDIGPSTNKSTLYTYLGIAFMILLIAMMNYVNLATARAVNKTRQIGIRKVIGAGKSQLMLQLFVESGVLVFLTLVLSLGMLYLIMPAFSEFIGKEMTIPVSQPTFWISLLVLGVAMTLLSGFYPAWLLARFKPVSALKGQSGSAKSSSVFRNMMVIFQFAVSCLLILGAAIMSQQVNYIQTMDTGYAKDQIVILGIRDQRVQKQFDVFKDELRTIPGVQYVSSSNSLPNDVSSNSSAEWIGKKEDDPNVVLYTNTADPSFVDLYELEIVAGRNFDPNVPGGEKAVLLNESAVKALGWENPLEMRMRTWFGDTARVVGILKDFHQHSLHLGIEPVQIFQSSGQFYLSIKVEGENTNQVIRDIEAKYQEFNPVFPFDYNFFDDVFDRAYQTEIKAGQLASWFTVMAIFIACLGLYGLVIHKVQNRVKEVGIRKVLGASVGQLLGLLSRDFAIMLLISFAIAAPLAYYLMSLWLDGFAYHVQISAWSFLLALLAMAFSAALTIGFRTYRSATSNPVHALRED